MSVAPAFPAPGSVRPDTGAALPPVAYASRDDVARAIDLARKAQPAWADLPLSARQEATLRLARRVLERRDEGMAILSSETGRSETECLISEIASTVDFVQAANRLAESALAPEKVRLSPLDFPGKKAVIEAVPHGVVGIIAPWNYPLINFFKHLFPALLAGNGVVMKPSEHCPRTGQWLASLCAEVLPPGLVQCVQGAGDVGRALLECGVDSITFTGSVPTGRKVSALAAERLIPFSAELGGKDAAIVLADCDLARTVAGVGFWALHNAGQNCASVERIYVEDAVADAFVARMVELVRRVRVAPQSDGAEIGPLHTAPQQWIVEQHVDEARGRGAQVLVGGAKTEGGFGFQPTLLDRCDGTMKIMTEETFGPIVAIQRVKDAEEAIRLANDSGYGLNGSVWTKDLKRGEALARRLHVGVCLVNNHALPAILPQLPWTGTRGTGPGVANSRHAYPAYVRRRAVFVDGWGQPDPFWFPANADLRTLAEGIVERGLGSTFSAFMKLLPVVGRRAKAIRELGGG